VSSADLTRPRKVGSNPASNFRTMMISTTDLK